MSDSTRGAAARIGEFVRQYSRMSGLDQEQVTCVHSDPSAEMAPLLLADLVAVVGALNAVHGLAYRLDPRSPNAPGGLQAILAHTGLVLDGQAGARKRVSHTGVVRPGEGPFYMPGGTGHRYRTCVHCGRRCGDFVGGGAAVRAQPVCHPNEAGRPDCYHLATTNPQVHPLQDCPHCTPPGVHPVDEITECYCNATSAPPCAWCTTERPDEGGGL